ncbi:hypothetical protein RJ639_033706 [Escallonia herrerae]|uniref:Uncharacterized protein n=1 Tax=Escallonia herrerae TaxID=1293975 RepID=A0AA89BK77_9ASTE|nr:hypothetical protein RJ639_033706 [Escallonia herrerae]
MARAKHGHLRRDSILAPAMNLRGKVAPSIPENSFGNFWTPFTVRFIASKSQPELQDLVVLLGNKTKDVAAASAKASSEDIGLTMGNAYREVVEEMEKNGVDVHICTSWCKFPMYEADFRWGKPFWVSSASRAYEMVTLVDSGSVLLWPNFPSQMHPWKEKEKRKIVGLKLWLARNRVKDDSAKAPIPMPAPSSPSFCAWAKWLLGSLVPLLLPYCKKKWDNLLTLEGNLEKVVEEVENVAEVVEKVATTTEKISAEAADKLPDHGKLKEAAEVVEHVSSLIAKEARQTQNFIHKIDDLKTDFQDLETMVEPLLDRVLEEKDAGK